MPAYLAVLIFAVSLSFVDLAYSQDRLVWSFSEGNDPSNKGRATARLSYGIPETDAIQVSGICDATSGTSAKMSTLILGTEIGNLKNGTQVKVRFSGGGVERELAGEVTGVGAEVGITGVIVRPGHRHPLWKTLTTQNSIDYMVPGYRTSSLKLKGARKTIRSFIQACRSYERASTDTTTAGRSSDGDISEADAFEIAKDLATEDGWVAFLEQFPRGFRSKLARAYLKKLRDTSNTPSNAQAAPSTYTANPKPSRLVIPAGNDSWSVGYRRMEYDGGRAKLAASVRSGGAELVGYCHRYGGNRKLTLVVRSDPALNSPDVTRALGDAVRKAPVLFGNVRQIGMRLNGRDQIPGASTYDNLGLGTEFRVLHNGKEIDYRSSVLGQMMSGNTLSIDTEAFDISFPLTGSRGALCSVLNQCEAKRRDCRGYGAQPAVATTPSRPRNVAPVVRTKSCFNGQYYSKRRKACRCPSGKPHFYGGKCRRYRDCPGDSVLRGGQCIKENEPERKPRCSGGRLYSLSRKVCFCPDYAPVWTGRKCVKRKKTRECGPGLRWSKSRRRCVAIRSKPTIGIRACSGGRKFSIKRGRCVCPKSRPHFYGGRCNRFRDCPGDSVRNSRGQCVKENEPSIRKPKTQRGGGLSNQQIINICNAMTVACAAGSKAACKRAQSFCDRG